MVHRVGHRPERCALCLFLQLSRHKAPYHIRLEDVGARSSRLSRELGCVSTRSKALFLQMIAYKARDRPGPAVAARTLSRPPDFAAYNASSQPFRSC